MHKISIPQEIVDQAVRRRGALHQYKEIVANRCALLAIDLQNAFLQPGMPSEIPAARDLVVPVNTLADNIRRMGGMVVWPHMTFSPAASSEWPTYFEGLSRERGRAMVEHLSPGVPGHLIYDGFEVLPQDHSFNKYRFSAFQPFPSHLEEFLRARNIDTVLVCGTLTNTCCESTARDAMSLNFKTIMVSDGMATRTDAEHNATLASMLLGFADCYLADEISSLLT